MVFFYSATDAFPIFLAPIGTDGVIHFYTHPADAPGAEEALEARPWVVCVLVGDRVGKGGAFDFVNGLMVR